MSNNSVNAQVDAYRAVHPIYESFSQNLKSLLIDILDVSHIKYQVVESRAKDVSSFAEKIARPGKSYQDPINEITDLCGCRIIVYYIDDVEKVADLIKREFSMHEENLTRQPFNLENDRFGYLSAHYIVRIGSGRSSLIEWTAYISLMAEIQIRTVIQHAWSAVSHALQYKQETSVPSKLQRRLFRIAGLFELADDEFVAIRDIRSIHRSDVKRSIETGSDVPLTPISIREFLMSWTGQDKLRELCLKSGFEYVTSEGDEADTALTFIYKLSMIGNIADIKALTKALNSKYEDFLLKLRSLSDTEWAVSYYFAVILILVLFNRKNITKEFLVSEGFHDTVADVVLNALVSV